MRTLQDQLKEWVQKNKAPKKKPRKKKRELGHKDYEELMGIHRPTYTRRKGALRQK